MVYMGKLDPQIAEEVGDHIKKEVLTAIPTKLDQLSTENVEVLRNKLHILRYYCLQKGVDSGVTSGLESTLETIQKFLEQYQIILIMLAVLAALQGINKGLGLIKDKTETSIDNAIVSVIDKIIGVLRWVIQLFTANSEPK